MTMAANSDILARILAAKSDEIAAAKRVVSPQDMHARALDAAASRPVISMSASLRAHAPAAVIAEFKRRSPSKGWIDPVSNPAETVARYAAEGAAAASVLTENSFFGGSAADLAAARAAAPALPLLRKDFITDPYQIDEARAIGADAVLLIASALSPEQSADLAAHAHTLGLEVLLELHTTSELGYFATGIAEMVGVNSRRLADFHTDITVAENLCASLPDGVVRVAESGISSGANISRLSRAGFGAFLCGEFLMRGGSITSLTSIS